MNHRKLHKVLIANRGEIAVRVIRGCHERGIKTLAVFSEADRCALHVRIAGEAVAIGPAPSSESYLLGDRILKAALSMGADGVHPGYGFLSENAGFARKVIDAGLVWIGPPPEAIEAMGSKTGSRQRMQAAGVPIVPGTVEAIESLEIAHKVAAEIGYPVMLKASAGGGGKGMRLVEDASQLASAWRTARSEAIRSFGDDATYIEKAIVAPRHVEVQVLADSHGNVVHLFERDCSIQRRNQKVIEEAPCPVLTQSTRDQMTAVAVKATQAVGYVGAGTVEFLLATDGSFYFLEMNTRLQVEHPITEMITGIDLVQAQLRVAEGERLWFEQEDLKINGHAVELRIYAEDPAAGFRPSPGTLTGYREPDGPWVRVDSGVYQGADVPLHYDPLIAKLVCWGEDREAACARAARALLEYRVSGVCTTIPFFRALLADPDFRASKLSTAFLSPERMERLVAETRHDEVAAIAAAIDFFESAHQPAESTASTGSTPNAWRGIGQWRDRWRGLR
jgi:acetyl-CoA carboxylase biotin carboxylase subunit